MDTDRRCEERIKIVFILGTLDMGGTERQFLETVRSLNTRRFACQVLAFGTPGKVSAELDRAEIPLTLLKPPHIKGKQHPGSYLQLYAFLRNMVAFLRRERPHIVQSYLLWANIYGAIAAKLAGIPLILTGRRATVDEASMRMPRFPHQWLQNLTNLWATAVVTNTQQVKQQILRQESYLVPQKVHVIPNGLQLELYPVKWKHPFLKRPIRIPEQAQVVGLVASLHPRKGHRDFLQAAAVVAQGYPDTFFLVVGRDEGIQAELEAYTNKLGLRGAVMFTGERGDIPELLAMIDVQVSSSYSEGLSNAIIEGMAVGNPIVATNVGGNSELVVHGETGLLVPPREPTGLAEAILQLLEDLSLRHRMGMAGRQRVERLFQMNHMIQQTEALYEELFQNR